MKQVSETIWMPYPECIDYLKTLDEDTEIMVSWYDESGKYIKGKLGVSKHRVWELLRTNMIGVTAISMLPSPYDPEAKTVNFATSCLWMREGIDMNNPLSNGSYIIHKINEGKEFELYWRGKNGFLTPIAISLDLIMSNEWERVE